MNRDLAARTPGEELWVRRRALGLRQAEMAARLGVGRTTLWAAERDRGGSVAPSGPPAAPGTPALLALARRRSGRTLREAAAGAGASAPTYLRWEARGDPRLVRYWAGLGFRFP